MYKLLLKIMTKKKYFPHFQAPFHIYFYNFLLLSFTKLFDFIVLKCFTVMLHLCNAAFVQLYKSKGFNSYICIAKHLANRIPN